MTNQNQNLQTAHELNDYELGQVSGGEEGNLVHVVATTVMNMITDSIIEKYAAETQR